MIRETRATATQERQDIEAEEGLAIKVKADNSRGIVKRWILIDGKRREFVYYSNDISNEIRTLKRSSSDPIPEIIVKTVYDFVRKNEGYLLFVAVSSREFIRSDDGYDMYNKILEEATIK